ncbi:YhcN/YlaJ family sporulation lipoprotein [Sediminibacillus halophilus]|uniref:Sporulation lipoprotein YhcN/YlaJ (Spore_YhcN_YlaJ) n=1 Tax=Sediminibacillus halophilus TaxID=482461 RepID=A0A1G9N0N7_9BACI|nr:YhcN/YlaJ family sporulation lipoprotein [Sediminibacillus halophilus]SDL80126.1 Sporulation lipoprotein YhcN/YlaJ (Spore_YhcN_YlaJ) [Sediminibacillus halophilus]
MKRIWKKASLPALLVFFLSVAGCTDNEDGRSASSEPDYDLTQVSNKAEVSQEIANQAKRSVLKNEEVIGARGVNTSEQILVAIEVRQMDRFNLKKLEKRITSDLENKFKEKKVTVSTDKKIYLELDELESQLQTEDLSKKKLDQETNRIKKLISDQA